MAAFPPSPQIVGKHGPVFEAYYMQADPLGTGSVGALDAANFLKKSKLSDVVLSKVWDMSDPTGKGYLEKTGFFVALKLISLAQNKQDMNVANLALDAPPPDLGPVEVLEPAQAAHLANIPWDINLSEKSKYDQLFDSLQPINNMVAGDKVKPILMNSKLPVDILGRIWDMSDIDKDGYLDRDEFAVAMHLVYHAREGMDIPSILRPGLVPPSKRKGVGLAGIGPPLPGAFPGGPLPGAAAAVNTWGRSTPVQGLTGTQPPWVVTAAEKANADMIFNQLDTDRDGLVSGLDVRDVMAQSGLKTAVLAHIWGLCDSQSQGKLTAEQFALALHLIQQKLKGVDPPAQLTIDMIPPSLRPVADPGTFGVRDGTNAGPYSYVADPSAIKEIDFIAKEIEEIKRGKLQLERDKAQQEADIKIRQSEVTILQKELDSLTGTLGQLESQKKEAQRRLDDLDDKRSQLEKNVQELKEKTQVEFSEVNKMKSLLSNRERLIKDQEGELEKLRAQLVKLKEEESWLEQNISSSKQQLDQLVVSQSEISNEIVLTRTHLQQFQNQYKDLDSEFASFSEQAGDASSFSGLANKSSNTGISGFSSFSAMDEFKDDPFKDQDLFADTRLSAVEDDPFQNEDPFKESDPFKSADPFASEDPFKDSFGDFPTAVKVSEDAFGTKPDPFPSLPQPEKNSSQGFDAFGLPWEASSTFSQPSQKTSSFSSDPFVEPAKPSSAPKKMPPPRPAPPKSKSPVPFGPSSTSAPKATVQPLSGFDSDPFGANDPFGSVTKSTTSNGSSDPFANFADFSPGKFGGSNDDDIWGGGGGPSTITVKDSPSSRSQFPAQNVVLKSTSRHWDDSEA